LAFLPILLNPAYRHFEGQAVGLFYPPSFRDRDFAFKPFIGKNGRDFRTFFFILI